MDHRQNEAPGHWFRSDRLFSSEGAWFFSTREGMEIGPYDSRTDAVIEAGFLSDLLKDAQPGDEARSVISRFVFDAYTFGRPLTPHYLRRRGKPPRASQRR